MRIFVGPFIMGGLSLEEDPARKREKALGWGLLQLKAKPFDPFQASPCSWGPLGGGAGAAPAPQLPTSFSHLIIPRFVSEPASNLRCFI